MENLKINIYLIEVEFVQEKYDAIKNYLHFKFKIETIEHFLHKSSLL
jgi:hypothetical protein